MSNNKWWKIEFHVHTPASNDYKEKSTTEEDILKAAMIARLDCLVITDHNCGDWIDRIKAKNREMQLINPKPDWYHELVIFPGVEISVGNNASHIHLLAIFDIICDTKKITSILSECGITDGFGDPLYTATNTGLIETVEKIENAGGMAIPAHIDDYNGLAYEATNLSEKLKIYLGKFTAAEFNCFDAFDHAEKQLRDAIGNLAKLRRSDAHHPENIGNKPSWIKMNRPTFSQLRLALSNHGYCVKSQDEDPNHLPNA